MDRIAFVFPGQGAQYRGMGRDFYERFPVSRAVFDLASRVVGLDIPALCFEEKTNLHITKYTQIAMLAVETAILRAVEEQGIRSEINAGLSLGEYGALLASGALSEEDAFRVVWYRGMLMQEAVPSGGAMAAVMGLAAEDIEKICSETEGIVSVANYNCPGQTVITGEAAAVERAGKALAEAGARRIQPLKVSGPFHSEMLAGAGEKLGSLLETVEIREFNAPYVSNVTAKPVRDPGMVPMLLARQVSSPVRWQQCVEAMIREGADTFVEIGPGKTLTSFLRRIDRNVKAFHIQNAEDLEQFMNR